MKGSTGKASRAEQQAQPVLPGHQLLAYFEMLQRDSVVARNVGGGTSPQQVGKAVRRAKRLIKE